MVTLEITVDSQTFTEDDFAVLQKGGRVLCVTGILNRRWEDYSAQAAAKCFGLSSVQWEQTLDDTPGSLTCLLGYAHCTKADIETRLRALNGIDDYTIYTLDWPF